MVWEGREGRVWDRIGQWSAGNAKEGYDRV